MALTKLNISTFEPVPKKKKQKIKLKDIFINPIQKHTFFNTLGSWIYQIVKIFTFSIYFILRGRFVKFKMVWRGLFEGIKIKI